MSKKTEHTADKCESVRNVQCDHLIMSGNLPSGRVSWFGTEKDRFTDCQVHSEMELDTFWTATMHSCHLFQYGMKDSNR